MKQMVFKILRFTSIVLAFFLSNVTLTKMPGVDFGLVTSKGLPIPYEYTWFPTFPSSQNNLIYAINFFFWIILLNLGISYFKQKSGKKNKENDRLISKDFTTTLLFSVVLFFMSLGALFLFG